MLFGLAIGYMHSLSELDGTLFHFYLRMKNMTVSTIGKPLHVAARAAISHLVIGIDLD